MSESLNVLRIGRYEARTKGRISEFLKIVNEMPKSRAWEKRAKKGTAKPWYNEVDEVER